MTYDDLVADLQRWSDRIRFAEIVREEAKRTVLVPGPASAVKLEAWLIAHGLDDVISVKMSQFLPPDTWYVIDEQAIEAASSEAIAELARQPLVFESRACPRCSFPIGTGHSPSCPISIYTAGVRVHSPTNWLKVIGA